MSPDGYYLYLSVPKPPPPPAPGSAFSSKPKETDVGVDADLVKKNYRRLSLRHHPDRRGGDAETFRVLNRAKAVLLNEKLRRQYDLLGLDLDDEEEEEEGHGEDGGGSGEGGGGGGTKDGTAKGGGGGSGEDETKEGGESGSSGVGGVMGHLASATLASIMQVAVRTAMMGAASTFLCRYRITAYPAVCFVAYVAFKIRRSNPPPSEANNNGVLPTSAPPASIGLGVLAMHLGRGEDRAWSWTFWFGEALVMTMFAQNSIPVKSTAALGGVASACCVASLLLRGKFWRYASIVGIECGLALIAVLAFPIMELILEEILNEKMRKVGEKIRAHAKRMESYDKKRREKR